MRALRVLGFFVGLAAFVSVFFFGHDLRFWIGPPLGLGLMVLGAGPVMEIELWKSSAKPLRRKKKLVCRHCGRTRSKHDVCGGCGAPLY